MLSGNIWGRIYVCMDLMLHAKLVLRHWGCVLTVTEAERDGNGAAGLEEGDDERKWEDKTHTRTPAHTHTHFFCHLLVPATITVGGPWPLHSLRMLKANPTGMLEECESWVRDRRREGWTRSGWRMGAVKKKRGGGLLKSIAFRNE